MRARTAAVNEPEALVVTADDELRRELRGLRTRSSSRAAPNSGTPRTGPNQTTRLSGGHGGFPTLRWKGSTGGRAGSFHPPSCDSSSHSASTWS